MPAYIIAQIKVHDPEEYRKYQSAFMAASKTFGVKVLVATDNAEIIEGDWPNVRTVIMEYPSIELAKAWYASKQYQEIIHWRHHSSETNMVLFDGFHSK